MRLAYLATGSGGGGVVPGTGFLNGEARQAAIANGVASKAIVLATPMPSAVYSITHTIKNTVDGFPIDLIGTISAQTAAGFTITFSTPTDSANYILSYIAAREF